MKQDLLYDPSVFRVGCDYQIIFRTKTKGLGWVEIDGARYTDEECGLLKYGPLCTWILTPRGGHRLVGSLTGVVASKSVTEASQGALSTNGNRAQSAIA